MSNSYFEIKGFLMMQEISNRYLHQQITEIQRTCFEEGNEDIFEFVRLITFPMLQQHDLVDKKDNLDYRTGDVLSMFIWQLTDYDFLTATTNPYHFRADWAYQLNSFIGNFFYDDAYFNLRRASFGTWEAIPSQDKTQNPRVLIEAARDNAIFHINVENAENSDEKKKILKQGMISSGNVEQLLLN